MQQRQAYHIDPCPSISVIASVLPFEADQQYNCKYGSDTCPPDGKHNTAHSLPLAYFEPPYRLEKLAVYDETHDCAVGGKQKIIESHRCNRRFGVSLGILRFDGRGVEERGGGDGVAGEAEDVQGRKVDCKAKGGFADVIGYGLRVEGPGPE